MKITGSIAEAQPLFSGSSAVLSDEVPAGTVVTGAVSSGIVLIGGVSTGSVTVVEVSVDADAFTDTGSVQR